MRPLGFGKKLYISSLGIIVLTILIIAIVNFYQAKASFLAKGKAGIQNVSDVLLKTIEVQYQLQREKLDSDLAMLTTESDSAGKIMLVKSRTADMEVIDSQTREKTALTLPKLIFGLQFVTNEHEIVDKVGQFSDSQIAIYQLFEEKLIKVSTSLKNADDTRPVGEYFGPSTLEYQSVMSQPLSLFFSGSGREKTLLLLSPFKDLLEDAIAGAYSVSRRILTQDMEGLVKKIRVSGHGYAFVSDGSGTILVHPEAAYSTLNIKEFQGGEEIMKTKNGFISYGHGNQLYHGYVNYFEPWDLYFTVAVSESALMTGITRQILTSAGLSGVIALIFGALVIGFMNRQLMNHMKGMATLAKEVAKGNFKHTFRYQAQDPIHDTVDSMNEMVKELAGMIREMNSGVDTLGRASGELNRISDQMTKGAETSVTKVNTVASAAEEMSANMDSVVAAMEQASTNLETVATGTSQMRSSIEQVARNSVHTREITRKAVEQARLASERVQQLGKAAEQINKVTEAINTISSQTNLLALNATIEAARAGEAGKGFAVVATEIKALAGQTAKATLDIAHNIQEIQDQVKGAVTEIQDISSIIHEINGFVKEAAAAIEVQAGTTNDIAENISQVSLGIQEVNENVAQSSAVSSQVAHEISDVLTASQQISEFSSQVKEKADSLNGVMLQLKAITEKFHI